MAATQSPPEGTELDPLAALLAGDQRRADARRNGERIIAAALQVLAERGFEAGIPEIADRAGVGRATVYRMFPTKSALLAAVVAHRCAALIARLEAARAEPDPARALRSALRELFARRASDRVILDALGSRADPRTEAATARMVDLLDGLLRAAQRDGTVRSDVTIRELRVLLGGCIHQLSQLGESDPAVWQRHADLVLDALRP